MKPPFKSVPAGIGLRQRRRADGSWRLWWEPNARLRAAGAKPQELDPARPTWSEREARRLQKDAGAPARKAGHGGRTLEALAEDLVRHRRFTSLKPATQRGYRADFAVIVAELDPVQVAALTKPMVDRWHERRATTHPTYAGKLARSLSRLMAHAELLGWRPENSNPCRALGAAAAKKRRRFASWDELDALTGAAEAAGHHAMALAITLAAFTGQRQSDIALADRAEFLMTGQDGPDGQPQIVWSLERSKRGNQGNVAIHPEAAMRLRPLLAAQDAPARLLIDEATGRPYELDLFRTRYAAIRKAAARACPSLLRPNLQFRDLRRTYGVLARLGGAAREDVGDVLGNAAGTDDALAQIYMPAQLASSIRANAAIVRPSGKDRQQA